MLAAIAFTIIGGFVWVVGREATKLAADMPKYQAEIVNKVENFSTVGGGASKHFAQFVTAISEALRGNKRSNAVKPTLPSSEEADSSSAPAEPEAAAKPEDQPEDPPGTPTNPLYTVSSTRDDSGMGTAFGAVTAVLSPLTNVGLVIVFTIFMLLSRDDLRDRLIRVLSGGRYIVTTKAIDEASRRISSYILAQTFVNSVYGLCIGLGLWMIGWFLGEAMASPTLPCGDCCARSCDLCPTWVRSSLEHFLLYYR